MMSRIDMPALISKLPPFTTLPESETTRVPRVFSTPSFAYSAPPMSMIGGTVVIVSTLLTTVGDA